MKARAKAGRYDYTDSLSSQVDHWLGGGHFFYIEKNIMVWYDSGRVRYWLA